MRKIIEVTAYKEAEYRNHPGDYSNWHLWIDLETEKDENLDHDALYNLLKPYIQNQWPNIKINCGACSGSSPTTTMGRYPHNKDFYIHFKTPEDEAEFILENQILVGIEV